MGFGTWEAITDAYLACHGANHIGDGGGAWSVELVTANLPSHNHPIGGSTGKTNANVSIQNHSADISVNIDHNHSFPIGYYDQVGATQTIMIKYIFRDSTDGSQVTSGASATWATVHDDGHIHEVSQTPHSHTLPSATGNTGSATPFDIMPTYVGVYTWYRSA